MLIHNKLPINKSNKTCTYGPCGRHLAAEFVCMVVYDSVSMVVLESVMDGMSVSFVYPTSVILQSDVLFVDLPFFIIHGISMFQKSIRP